MDIRHVTLLRTLRIFEDKKHLCSSQLHFKHYYTIHFPCTPTHNTALFLFFFFFFKTEVGTESWSWVRSPLYFQCWERCQAPAPPVLQQRKRRFPAPSDFVNMSYIAAPPRLRVRVLASQLSPRCPQSISQGSLEENFLDQTEHSARGTVARHRPLLKSKQRHLEGWLTEPTVQGTSRGRAAQTRLNLSWRYVSINVFIQSKKKQNTHTHLVKSENANDVKTNVTLMSLSLIIPFWKQNKYKINKNTTATFSQVTFWQQ